MDFQEPSRDWLQQFISAAVGRNLCTRIGCTTCGAHEFRAGLMARLGVPLSELVAVPLPPLGVDRAERLLDLMSELKPPEHDMGFYSEPMRLMIFDCWIALGGDKALPAMQERLGQSWAGPVLRAMIVHEEERRRVWQAHEARLVKDHERRLRRDRERQLAQERRILQKKGRDKRFWANAHNDLEKNGYNPMPAAPPPSAYQQQTSHSPPSPPPRLGLSVSSRTALQASATAAASK